MVSQSKAETYLHVLDDARSQSNWGHVPEAARKVAKMHALSAVADVANMEAKLFNICDPSDPRLPVSGGTELAQSLGKNIANENPEHHYIHMVAYAHALTLSQEYQKVVDSLDSLADLDKNSRKYKYTGAAIFKRRVLLGYAYEKLGDVEKAIQVYDTASSISKDDTHESLRWEEWLYHAFSQLAFSNYPQHVMPSIRRYHRVLKSLLQYPASRQVDNNRRLSKLWHHLQWLSGELESDTTNNDQVVTEIQSVNDIYERYLFAQSKFPKASESNLLIQNYAELLVKNWAVFTNFDGLHGTIIDKDQTSYTNKILATLRRAAATTFHSCAIMRLMFFVLSALGSFDEALLAFNTYKSYLVRSEIRKQSGTEDEGSEDRLDVCKAFTKAIEIVVYVKKDSERAEEYADGLAEWVPQNEQGSTIANAYTAMGVAYRLVSENQHDDEHYKKYADLVLDCYEKSLDSGSSETNARVYLSYAVCLARAGRIHDALSACRKGLVQDKTIVDGWHLLALLLSVQEEYDTAIKVINTALAMDIVKTDDETKRSLIQMKMTQIALIEASTSSEQALDKMPEVLSLYSELFPTTEPETPQQRQSVDLQPTRSRRSIFRARSVKRTDGAAAAEKAAPAANGSEKKVIPQPATNVSSGPLFRSIWLWIAALYRRSGQLTEAEQAILEAENQGGPTPETHTELALLIRKERPVHAMEEFEAAIDEESNHLGAVLGLAQLIISYGVEHKTLFISEKDAMAAHSRILGLVETLCQRTPGRRTAECFWVLSQLYELSKRDNDAQKALWKTVELEENRPVRDYSCITSI